MKLTTGLLCLTAFAHILAAQAPIVNPGGVVNAASYAYATLPSGAIAQGSIFAIFGSNLGPTPYVQAGAYPIPTTLGSTNTTVKVTSGSTTTQAYLFLSSAGQITAMLPSSTPVGTASLTVTTSGGTSAAVPFQVVASSFGVFAMNSGGSGPGVITNAESKPFGLVSAANPGDAAVIWGTGLGPVTGNEANGALPGDMATVSVEVYVGASKANATYRGRSGCCAGLDQIVFTTPSVLGCRIPVVVKINSIVSNSTTMAIAAPGSHTCSDPGGPPATDLQKYTQNGYSVGSVSLSRIASSFSVPTLGTITSNTDVGSATFIHYTPLQLDATANPFGTSQIGACTVSYLKGSSAGTDPLVPKTLDAGAAITVNGAGGSKQLTKTATANFISYSGTLSSQTTGYLEPGTFTVTGPGGTDIGGFTASITIAANMNWTNQAAITDVTRGSGQQITWTGADPSGQVMISGTSTTGTGTDAVGASFICFANAADNQFTIPAQVLLALPVSATVSGVPTGALMVGTFGAPKSFAASGLDLGFLTYNNLSLKSVNYK